MPLEILQIWRIILLGCIGHVTFSDLAMGFIHTVPDTCGREFFLPPVNHAAGTSVLDLIQIVACRDASREVVQVNITLATIHRDVVQVIEVLSNLSALVGLQNVTERSQAIAKYGLHISSTHEVSAYARATNGSDVMTILPVETLSNDYLVPDLRVSDSDEQTVTFYSIYTNTTVETTVYPDVTLSRNNSDRNSSSSAAGSNQMTSANLNNTVSFKRSKGTATVSETSEPLANERNYTEQPNVTTSSSINNAVLQNGTTVLPVGDDTASIKSEYFLSSAMQTFSFHQPGSRTVFLQSNKPVGVLVLVKYVSLSSSTSSSTTSFTDVQGAVNCSSNCSGTGGSKHEFGTGSSGLEGSDHARVSAAEMVLPLSSFGKQFYVPFLEVFCAVKYVVAGYTNSTLKIRWDSTNTSASSQYTLFANTSLVFEHPLHHGQSRNGFMWLLSSSPILVFAVIDICRPRQEGTTSSEHVNAFFVPPVEQFFRCAVESSVEPCRLLCPSFWNSQPCDLQTQSATSVLPTSPPNVTTPLDALKNSIGEISQTARETSVTVKDICVSTNESYLHFRLDMTSVTFHPSGIRLARLYGACVPNIMANGGLGDGLDNDCDGVIDEEIENMTDDDLDGTIDEDTSSDCVSDINSRTVRSRDLQRAMDDPAPIPDFFDYEDEESQMPLFAVIISLSVAIFAVVAVISIFMLMELMSKRRQLRNTKIRPFVS